MNVYKQLDLLLFLILIIQTTFSIVGTRRSDKEIPRELKIYIFQRLHQKAGSQMKRLRFAQQKYLTSTKKQFQTSKNHTNSTINVGVFTMTMMNLKPWQLKCAIKVFIGGMKHYGCYCGKGNSIHNGEPSDAIDAVCKEHDVCYYNTVCTLKSGAGYKWNNEGGKVCIYRLWLLNDLAILYLSKY